MIKRPFFPLVIIHLINPDRCPTRQVGHRHSLSGVAGVRWLDWYGDATLLVVDVGLACCTLEFEAAASARPAVVPEGPLPTGTRVVVVVSGTVTDRLAPAVLAIVDAAAQLGAPPAVVSLGACASSGGPYWDSYAVTKGVDQLVPVDVYVPGCPPTPEALQAVLDGLSGPGWPSDRSSPVPA